MTPVEPCTDARLRARLAATPLREPAPEQVRRWQAALRELPPPPRRGHPTDGPSTPIWERVGHAADGLGQPTAEGPTGIPEGLGMAAESLRTDHPGPAAAADTTPPGHSANPTDPSPVAPEEPEGRSARSSRAIVRRALPVHRPIPLSSDRGDADVRPSTVANISSEAAEQPAAMATGPLTMADADVAVAKIGRSRRTRRVAAAIGGLAAAIAAVAVLGPATTTRSPSAAADDPSASGPSAIERPADSGPSATAAQWPGGPAATRPVPGGTPDPTPPTASPGGFGPPPSNQPGGSAPVTLTRAQLLATPPTGRDLGPLAAPPTLSSCLARHGSTTQPIAARRVVLDGHAGVLLVLPTELPGRVRLLVVDPHCSTALADDTVGR